VPREQQCFDGRYLGTAAFDFSIPLDIFGSRLKFHAHLTN